MERGAGGHDVARRGDEDEDEDRDGQDADETCAGTKKKRDGEAGVRGEAGRLRSGTPKR